MADITRSPAPGELLVRNGDRVERMYAVMDGETAWVFHDGTVHQLAPEGRAAGAGARHHASLTSPMPATVVAVNVRPGEAVTRGQILIVLEAMKMELPVRAPGDGIVATVHCGPGDLVQPNVSLIELE